jgi:hypothetical protein
MGIVWMGVRGEDGGCVVGCWWLVFAGDGEEWVWDFEMAM